MNDPVDVARHIETRQQTHSAPDVKQQLATLCGPSKAPPAFEAAMPILSQLLKAETAD